MNATPAKPRKSGGTSAAPKRQRAKRMPAEARKEVILAAASEFFARHGLEASTRDLADRIGVRQALLYKYFPSKEALIESVFDRLISERRDVPEATLSTQAAPLADRLFKYYEFIGLPSETSNTRLSIRAALEDLTFSREICAAVARGLIETDITIDAKSGISGGGRSLTLANHFSEVNEAVSAYGMQGHRHLAEIHQELQALAGESLNIIFTPHIVPMTRGLLATCYARLKQSISASELLDLYRDYYGDAPFVRVVTRSPSTKWATGNNFCYVHPTVSHSGTHLIALGAIDNLVKGAAGQAIQNANLVFGLPENMGLDWPELYP